MAGLPTGTVTFLFTDIEGSTRLLQQLGDRYADVSSGSTPARRLLPGRSHRDYTRSRKAETHLSAHPSRAYLNEIGSAVTR